MSNRSEKKRVLLTSFGNKLLYEFWNDFAQNDAFELFVSDAASTTRPQTVTANILKTRMGTDVDFSEDLLRQCIANNIRFVIPGSDEEALALMRTAEEFRKEGIEIAVQDEKWVDRFSSKYAMYEYLRTKDISLPEYRLVNTCDDVDRALESLGYGQQDVIVKPDAARGGKGIYVLDEKDSVNSEGLSVITSAQFKAMMDGSKAYLLMPYLRGIICDVDVLAYKNDEIFFGIRKRFENITKLFSGNHFSADPAILDYIKRLHAAVPTKYLVDYDLMITDDGTIELLEINPRPSGSTISYLPYGYNLYSILADSYLNDHHRQINYDDLSEKKSYVFCKMTKEA